MTLEELRDIVNKAAEGSVADQIDVYAHVDGEQRKVLAAEHDGGGCGFVITLGDEIE